MSSGYSANGRRARCRLAKLTDCIYGDYPSISTSGPGRATMQHNGHQSGLPYRSSADEEVVDQETGYVVGA